MRIGCDSPTLLGHRREPIHLVEGVDDDAAHSCVETLGQFVVGLVVAVHLDALHRESSAQRERQLPATSAQQRAALLLDDLEHAE